MGMLKIQYQSNTGLFQSNQLIIIKLFSWLVNCKGAY
jgi:hypothetical protein